MNRRYFIFTAALAMTEAALSAPRIASPKRTNAKRAPSPDMAVEELSISTIGEAFANGSLTSQRLTQLYLNRIEALNRRGPNLRAVLETNPEALKVAFALDAERKQRGPRGPLHGIPILIKDNIETADHLMTTAGSLALEGWYAPQDAPLIAKLRAAGAIILGKTNLSEWANFRSTHSSSGWSARGGQARNPYALNRTPSGSSSGSAISVAANLCAIAVGSETDGSIVSPASINGIVGFKPTVGLVSRTGIVPISHSQDTAGPLARSVHDAAILLGAMSGKDINDPASIAVGDRFESDYTRFLNNDGLRGARLGIARKFFADNAPLNRFLEHAVTTLKQAGAVVVDPADMETHGTWSAPESIVLLYEFKADLNAYLARLPNSFAIHTLADLIRFNDSHSTTELPLFDQELLRQAQAKGSLDEAAYQEARAECLKATRTQGIDAMLNQHKLDAIVSLTSGPAWLIDAVNGDYDTGGCSSPAAIAGYPHITVPLGLYQGLPVGLSFFSTAFSEPTLIKLASGLEHVVKGRKVPRFLASV